MAESPKKMKPSVFVDKTGRRYVLDHQLEENLPLFDWQRMLPKADEIIFRVGAGKTHSSAAHPCRVVAGLDLTEHRESLARLLASIAENYIVAMQDYEDRHAPDKPKRRLEDNCDNGDEAPAYDYSEWADGCPTEPWDEYWRENYGRGRGRPGTNLGGGPPLTPAHVVYHEVRDWWRKHGLGKFHPTFLSFKCDDEDYDEAEFNAPSRFLLRVLQFIDRRYTVENARGLYETVRKADRKNKPQNV